MKAPAQTLRTVFALSVLLTTFWVIGFVWEPVFRGEAPIAILVVLTVAITALISWATFRGGRLTFGAVVALGDLVATFVPRVAGAYLVMVPLVGAVVWVLVRVFSPSPDHSETGTFIMLMAIWLPLWAAPALGAEWAWRSMRKRGVA